jgi:anti-sigma regulatory factor (Ser/Thr protein kinase)
MEMRQIPMGDTDDQKTSNRPEVITLSFPARADLVVLARFTAATLGARAGFDVEEIEDLRLAVDELVVSFEAVQAGGTVQLRCTQSGTEVRIECTVEQGSDANPNQGIAGGELWGADGELSKQLLDALVDEHGREHRDGRPCVWLRKQRAHSGR